MSATPAPSHIETLRANFREIRRLLEIHKAVSGAGVGYKHDVEVLNKSAIVLLVACWEAFVEDLAANAFAELLARCPDHSRFPRRVLTIASRDLRADPDESQVWLLAGTGWRTVLESHKAKLFKRYLGTFNTPRPEKVDFLFLELVGVSSLSSAWHWNRVTAATAAARLDALVTLRGEIAHRVASGQKVLKRDVQKNLVFLTRLAVLSSNHVDLFLEQHTGARPWRLFYVSHG